MEREPQNDQANDAQGEDHATNRDRERDYMPCQPPPQLHLVLGREQATGKVCRPGCLQDQQDDQCERNPEHESQVPGRIALIHPSLTDLDETTAGPVSEHCESRCWPRVRSACDSRQRSAGISGEPRSVVTNNYPPLARRQRPGSASRPRPGEKAAQSRSNSLPSMSCITRHDSLSSSAGSRRTRTAPSDQSRAFGLQRGHALLAHEPGADPHVKVQPVLDDLAFGNALEEQSRART
jgi:hypothetical protein